LRQAGPEKFPCSVGGLKPTPPKVKSLVIGNQHVPVKAKLALHTPPIVLGEGPAP